MKNQVRRQSRIFILKLIMFLSLFFAFCYCSFTIYNEIISESMSILAIVSAVVIFPVLAITLTMIFRGLWMIQPGLFRSIKHKKVTNTWSFSNTPKKLQKEDITSNVTVLVPVYTESFEVIKDTLEKAHEATNVYENGALGKGNIVVCDDALMIWADNNIQEFEKSIRQKKKHNDIENKFIERIDYYRKNGIGFICRPKSVPGISLTQRPGMFKKAGNINHAFLLTEELEKEIKEGMDSVIALKNALNNEQFSYSYAEGDVFINDIILLLDKDSITPREAIISCIPEFELDPKLGYTQNKTIPVIEKNNYFTRISSYFTRMMFNIHIESRALMDGIVLFVGHNGFIRKTALKDIGYFNENCVAEDMDFTLKMNTVGYHGKYINYKGQEFEEFVSLDFRVESLRQTRYCFGTMQVIVNPIPQWLKKGVFTDAFKGFCKSSYTNWGDAFDFFTFGLSFLYLAWLLLGQVLFMLSSNSIYTFPIDIGLLFILSNILYSIGSDDYICYKGSFRGLLKNIWAFILYNVMMSCQAFYITKGLCYLLLNIKVSFAVTSIEIEKQNSVRKALKNVTKAFSKDIIYLVLLISAIAIYLIAIGNKDTNRGGRITMIVMALLFPYITYNPLIEAIKNKFRFKSLTGTSIDG